MTGLAALFGGLTFGWPMALLLLPAPLLLRLLPARSETQAVQPPPLLAEAMAATRSEAGRAVNWPTALLWLAWVAVVTATAQPTLLAGATVMPASGRALELVIDLSSSMERKDFRLQGEPVDRLTALKSVARDFIAKRQGDRIGMVLFADQAFSAAPISYDLSAIANTLEEAAIGMAGRATAIGDGLGLALVKLRDDSARQKAIILLSDGTNNAGQAEPEDAAKLAKELGIAIHTIGMASEKGETGGLDPAADLDEATLKTVAEISGGRFFRARTTDELAQVYAELDRIETSESPAPPTVPRIDIRNWLLLAAAAALALASLAALTRRAA